MCKVRVVCNRLLYTERGNKPTGLTLDEAQVQADFPGVPYMHELSPGAIGTCEKPTTPRVQAFCAGCDGKNVRLMSESPSLASKIGEANWAGMEDNAQRFGFISPPGQEIPTGFDER